MSIEVDFDGVDFTWDLANGFARSFSTEWEGRDITLENTPALEEDIRERIVGLFQMIHPDSPMYAELAIRLAWIGTDPEKRLLLERHIEQLFRLPDGRYVGAGWFTKLIGQVADGVSSVCHEIGEFWQEHKTEILIGAAAVATAIIVVVIAVYTGGTAGGSAAAAGGALLDNLINGNNEPKQLSNSNKNDQKNGVPDLSNHENELSEKIVETSRIYNQEIPNRFNSAGQALLPSSILEVPSTTGLSLKESASITKGLDSVYGSLEDILPYQNGQFPSGSYPSPFYESTTVDVPDLKKKLAGPSLFDTSFFPKPPTYPEIKSIPEYGPFSSYSNFAPTGQIPANFNSQASVPPNDFAMPDPKPSFLLDEYENYLDQLKLERRVQEESDWKEFLIEQKERIEFAEQERKNSIAAYEKNQTGSRHLPIVGPKNNDLWIGFINGINTSVEGAQSHQKYIQELFSGNCGVNCTYNNSNGALVDLIEVFTCNYNGYSPNTVNLIKEEFENFHKAHQDNPHKKMIKLCHSQGTSHVLNALMGSPKEIRNRVIVIAIAPSKVVPREMCYQSYNYASKKDLVHYGELLSSPLFNTGEYSTSAQVKIAFENHKELVLLDPDSEATGMDHDLQSPTFVKLITDIICEYIKLNGEYR